MLECFLALVIVIYSILIKSYNHVAPLYYEEERQRLLKEKANYLQIRDLETVHACMEFLLNSKSDLLLVRIGEEAYKELQEAKVNSAFSKVAEAIKW